MAKWYIQDGVWWLNCCKEEEWNFCYVWPQAPGKPRRLVVPSSLQMGWVESAPYFCMPSITAQDVASQYIETDIGLLPRHKFEQWAGADFAQINKNTPTQELHNVLEVYMDDYIATIIPTSKAQIIYVTRGILLGIHDVFPPSNDDSKDPILAKKLQKGDGTFESNKCILGFDLMATEKQCGWKEKRGRHYFQSYINGSKELQN